MCDWYIAENNMGSKFRFQCTAYTRCFKGGFKSSSVENSVIIVSNILSAVHRSNKLFGVSLTDICRDMHPLVGEVLHSSLGAEGRAEENIRPQHRLWDKVSVRFPVFSSISEVCQDEPQSREDVFIPPSFRGHFGSQLCLPAAGFQSISHPEGDPASVSKLHPEWWDKGAHGPQ